MKVNSVMEQVCINRRRILNEEETLKLEELYSKLDDVDNELDMVNNELDPLLKKRDELIKTNCQLMYEICDIKGHRLDANSEHFTRAYGTFYTCLDCGRQISDKNIRDFDVMETTGKSKYSKILYKR